MKLRILYLCVCCAFFQVNATFAGVRQKQVVRVGALLPLTGSLAAIGRTNLEGMKLAAEDLNASQSRFRYRIVTADTQGEPDIGAQQIRILGKQGVITIFGAYQSSVTYSFI